MSKSAVFSLVSCVAMVHAVRAAMHSLKKTGTDFSSAKGMDPKSFFEVMGQYEYLSGPQPVLIYLTRSKRSDRAGRESRWICIPSCLILSTMYQSQSLLFCAQILFMYYTHRLQHRAALLQYPMMILIDDILFTKCSHDIYSSC